MLFLLVAAVYAYGGNERVARLKSLMSELEDQEEVFYGKRAARAMVDVPDGSYCEQKQCASVANCAGQVTCSSATDSVCSQCADGFYDAGVPGNDCAECNPIDNCVGQVTCNSAGDSVCSQCAQGFYGDNCAECSAVANCVGEVTCSSATDSVCSQCAQGFYDAGVPGDDCAACNAIDNCAGQVTCDSDDDETCDTCAEGFYGSGTDMCIECTDIPNCDSVTCSDDSDQTCASCASGYSATDSCCVNENPLQVGYTIASGTSCTGAVAVGSAAMCQQAADNLGVCFGGSNGLVWDGECSNSDGNAVCEPAPVTVEGPWADGNGATSFAECPAGFAVVECRATMNNNGKWANQQGVGYLAQTKGTIIMDQENPGPYNKSPMENGKCTAIDNWKTDPNWKTKAIATCRPGITVIAVKSDDGNGTPDPQTAACPDGTQVLSCMCHSKWGFYRCNGDTTSGHGGGNGVIQGNACYHPNTGKQKIIITALCEMQDYDFMASEPTPEPTAEYTAEGTADTTTEGTADTTAEGTAETTTERGVHDSWRMMRTVDDEWDMQTGGPGADYDPFFDDDDSWRMARTEDDGDMATGGPGPGYDPNATGGSGSGSGSTAGSG